MSVAEEVIAETSEFVTRRLYGVLRDEGCEHDVTEAVLAAQGTNPALAHQAVSDLSAVIAADRWMDVFTAYARCKRIVRSLNETYVLNPAAYVKDATRQLHAIYEAVLDMVHDIPSLAAALTALQPAIDTFFEDVLVMADDPDLRVARLALVQAIAALPDGLADLALLRGF